jgi:mannose-1-phosphate guanylyltransferase
MVTAAIIAGGQGARFWPVSRNRRPKQFLSISPGGESLLQGTARRVASLVGNNPIIVVTNGLHEPLVREHLPTAIVIAEPVARNTAAPIGLAALWVERSNPDEVMIVLPADHAIQDDAKFVATLSAAVALATREDLLVTVGIPPTSPHTGYGYIQRGEPIAGSEAFQVRAFHEKPNLLKAREYLASGEFAWNSGMFIWRASAILKAIKQHLPKLSEALERIRPALGTPREAGAIKAEFDTLESISIDVGIMERAKNCAVVAAQPFGWSDVGAWDSWAEHFPKDPAGNVVNSGAQNAALQNTVLIDSSNCVVYSEQRVAALIGCQDLMVIDSPDGLLICPRDRAQEVRAVVDELKRRGQDRVL